jgi:hypothetical protein
MLDSLGSDIAEIDKLDLIHITIFVAKYVILVNAGFFVNKILEKNRRIIR